MTSEIKKDSNGEIFEILTFENKIQEIEYSKNIHKINFKCNFLGLNPEKHKDFLKAKELISIELI